MAIVPHILPSILGRRVYRLHLYNKMVGMITTILSTIYLLNVYVQEILYYNPSNNKETFRLHSKVHKYDSKSFIKLA